MTEIAPAKLTSTSAPEPPAHRLSRMARLRNRVAALSRSKHAFAALMVVSVIDGSVFPVPPFAILVPMVLAEPRRWFRLALLGTVASLFGGLLGYGLGFLAMKGIASGFAVDTSIPIHVSFLGIDTTLRGALTEQFWILALLCSVLPTPYKVVAIGSGLVGVGLPEFLLASVIGRTVRFSLVSGAFALFGERARRWIRF